MLNLLWASFFIISFIVAIFSGSPDVWNALSQALFSSAKTAFEISLNLTGILCLWLGLLKIAENSGLTELLSKALMPLFKKIMPDVPADSPAFGSIVMNMAANFLGLDNAATPMGLKAMEQLQAVNHTPDRASPAQVLFMVINSSAVTLIPITILMYRAELGSSNPSAVFIPILFATSVSTLVGFLSVAMVQRLNIFNRVVLGYLLFFVDIIAAAAWYFLSLPEAERYLASSSLSNALLFGIVTFFIAWGLIKRLNVYETFIDGAKEGFSVAVRIIPYLVAMLVGIAVFRASGAMDYVVNGLAYVCGALGLNTDFVPAMPTALLKPLSGSGARAMMIETMQTYGADSFAGFVSCIVQGSTETTFYVLAVYFGSVKITKTGAALPCALLADAAGIIAAICFGYMFY